MSVNKNSTMRDAEAFNTYFAALSAEDQLAIVLNPALEIKPGPEVVRRSEIASVRAEVDGTAEPASIARHAKAVEIEGARVKADLDHQFRQLRGDAFAPYRTVKVGEWYAFLVRSTETVKGTLDAWKAHFPTQAIPYPITTADIAALSARLAQLSSASPDEAKLLVMDAVKREDIPFLVAAGSSLRSFLSFKNSWRGDSAQNIAVDLLAEIDVASWTRQAEAAEYCDERVEAYTDAWRQFLTAIKSSFVLDPIYRQVGAFFPVAATIVVEPEEQ